MANDPRLEAMGDTPGSDVCGCTRVMLNEGRKWGPSLGVCMKCDRLRKVQFVQRVEKWLCARCEKSA